jgi:hypothetical protein
VRLCNGRAHDAKQVFRRISAVELLPVWRSLGLAFRLVNDVSRGHQPNTSKANKASARNAAIVQEAYGLLCALRFFGVRDCPPKNIFNYVCHWTAFVQPLCYNFATNENSASNPPNPEPPPPAFHARVSVRSVTLSNAE